MAIDLNLLQCFKVVAEQGSISKAALLLHLSQPAVSTQIKKLEEQLNRRVFHRHNRGLKTNDVGIELLNYAKRIFDTQNDIEAFLRQSETVPSGALRIGSYTTVSSYLISAPVTDYLKRFPGVSIAYDYDPSAALLQKLRTHELDCAILSDVHEDPSLERQPLVTDELILVSAPSRPESKRRDFTPKDLASVDFLSYPLRNDLCYRLVEQHYGRYLSRARVPLETTSFDTLKQMLLRGAGVTFMPRYLVARELKKGALKELTVGTHKLPITFMFVTRKGAAVSTATACLRQHLLDWFQEVR